MILILLKSKSSTRFHGLFMIIIFRETTLENTLFFDYFGDILYLKHPCVFVYSVYNHP